MTPTRALVPAHNISPSPIAAAAVSDGSRRPGPARTSRRSRRKVFGQWRRGSRTSRSVLIAGLGLGGIVAHLVLSHVPGAAGTGVAKLPVLLVLLVGGVPLVLRLGGGRCTASRVGSSGGGVDHRVGAARRIPRRCDRRAHAVRRGTLEQFAVAQGDCGAAGAGQASADTRASTTGSASSRRCRSPRSPSATRCRCCPHEICPVDGEVLQGHGTMDESYLTGEPFRIAKGPGAKVLSGAINGDASLTVRAIRVAADSRYARIMQVMQEAEQRRPGAAADRRSTRRLVYAAGARAGRRPPGGGRGTRSGFSALSWSRRHARCSSRFRWRSSGRFRRRPGAA